MTRRRSAGTSAPAAAPDRRCGSEARPRSSPSRAAPTPCSEICPVLRSLPHPAEPERWRGLEPTAVPVPSRQRFLRDPFTRRVELGECIGLFQGEEVALAQLASGHPLPVPELGQQLARLRQAGRELARGELITWRGAPGLRITQPMP